MRLLHQKENGICWEQEQIYYNTNVKFQNTNNVNDRAIVPKRMGQEKKSDHFEHFSQCPWYRRISKLTKWCFFVCHIFGGKIMLINVAETNTPG